MLPVSLGPRPTPPSLRVKSFRVLLVHCHARTRPSRRTPRRSHRGIVRPPCGVDVDVADPYARAVHSWSGSCHGRPERAAPSDCEPVVLSASRRHCLTACAGLATARPAVRTRVPVSRSRAQTSGLGARRQVVEMGPRPLGFTCRASGLRRPIVDAGVGRSTCLPSGSSRGSALPGRAGTGPRTMRATATAHVLVAVVRVGRGSHRRVGWPEFLPMTSWMCRFADQTRAAQRATRRPSFKVSRSPPGWGACGEGDRSRPASSSITRRPDVGVLCLASRSGKPPRPRR